MVARFLTVLGIGSADESNVCIFGREVCRRTQARVINDQENLYHAACADHCVMVLMAFLTCGFLPRELAAQDLLGHNARLRFG